MDKTEVDAEAKIEMEEGCSLVQVKATDAEAEFRFAGQEPRLHVVMSLYSFSKWHYLLL